MPKRCHCHFLLCSVRRDDKKRDYLKLKGIDKKWLRMSYLCLLLKGATSCVDTCMKETEVDKPLQPVLFNFDVHVDVHTCDTLNVFEYDVDEFACPYTIQMLHTGNATLSRFCQDVYREDLSEFRKN